jgi:predicted Zn-dependent protease
MKNCSKCFSQEIEELVWIDTISGEITDRQDEYYCRQCAAKVDVVLTPDNEEWCEDITPIED